MELLPLEMSLCTDDGIRKECVFLRLTAETDVLITASPSADSVFAIQHPCLVCVLFYQGDLDVLTAINGLRLMCRCKLLPITSGDLGSFSSKVTI
jgi:hypothetical protein